MLFQATRTSPTLPQHRAKYRANYFHRASPTSTNDPEAAGPTDHTGPLVQSEKNKHAEKGETNDRSTADLVGEANGMALPQVEKPDPQMDGSDNLPPTDVLEVWFAGCHEGRLISIGTFDVPIDEQMWEAVPPIIRMLILCLISLSAG